ncbi:putative heme/steroid binding protein [Anaerosolibacter carboniphilus]|uniref:Putative heme/steroid binding protein n=1 Tax=Anaerosolibacter carboniphilus TaxID=1417629 RepID=A0A841L8M9_9FIRM|nr:cytochrome b5 domain-containing protein [Anaerosolibacter carboniphilus]MBB6218615.1 putative heme/steroid binding protein [Anaerosolibacter carboniphilus]
MLHPYYYLPYPSYIHWYTPWNDGWMPCDYCHPYQRMHCQNLYQHRDRQMFQDHDTYSSYPSRQIPQKEFTLSELAIYDGSGGNPAYVAVNDIVYDVGNEATWGGGTHFGLYAGKDLTTQFKGCHGMESILNKLPKVGILKA